jgi:hypothetical protein
MRVVLPSQWFLQAASTLFINQGREMITPHKKNVLTHANTYKLTKWLDENKEVLTNTTQAKIAAKATSELLFSVTTGNICGACNVLGIKLGQRELRARSTRVHNDVPKLIAKHLVYLYETLGDPVPQSLHDIATR